MATTQDELQIRIGLSVAGAEAVQNRAAQADQKVERVKGKVRVAEVQTAAVETRLNALEKKFLKIGVGFLVGSALEQGLDYLVPTDDQNAMSVLSKTGARVAVQAAFSPNPMGVILALVQGTISLIQEDIRLIKDLIKSREDEDKDFRDAFDRIFKSERDRVERRLVEIEKLQQRLEEQMYADLRAGL